MQVLRGDLPDGRRHGGREQRDLFVFRGIGEDPFNVLGETHLQHLIGFIEHQVVQVREVQRSALKVVDDAPRSADDDMRTAPKAGQLHGVGLAAVDRQHGDPGQMRAVTTERLGDLQCQLTSRRQHQRLSILTRGVDPRQDRDGEGGGLPGAGLGKADDIGTAQQRRDGGRLDGRGRLIADIGDGLEHRSGNLQVGESVNGRDGGIGRADFGAVFRGCHCAWSLVPARVAAGSPVSWPVPYFCVGNRLAVPAALVAIAAALAGCSSGDSTVSKTPLPATTTTTTTETTAGSAPETPTSQVATPPSESPAPPDPCSVNLAAPAIAKAVSELPRDPRSQQSWNPEPIAGNYNECAQLSAVIVRANTNADNPNTRAVMFHLGKFIPTGVPDTFGFNGIDSTQSTGDTVALTFAGGMGLQSVVKFRWNGAGVELIGNTG